LKVYFNLISFKYFRGEIEIGLVREKKKALFKVCSADNMVFPLVEQKYAA
jgi:hypothetical protein